MQRSTVQDCVYVDIGTQETGKPGANEAGEGIKQEKRTVLEVNVRRYPDCNIYITYMCGVSWPSPLGLLDFCRGRLDHWKYGNEHGTS